MAQPEFRDQIHKLTAPANSNAPEQQIERGSDASLRQRLTLAHGRIRELDHDNRQLRNQIAYLHGQSRADRITTTNVIDTVHNTNAQITTLNSQPGPR